MKALEKKEVFAWCQHRSVKVTDDGYLYFDAHERRCIAIELPAKPYQLVALANALLPYTETRSVKPQCKPNNQQHWKASRCNAGFSILQPVTESAQILHTTMKTRRS